MSNTWRIIGVGEAGREKTKGKGELKGVWKPTLPGTGFSQTTMGRHALVNRFILYVIRKSKLRSEKNHCVLLLKIDTSQCPSGYKPPSLWTGRKFGSLASVTQGWYRETNFVLQWALKSVFPNISPLALCQGPVCFNLFDTFSSRGSVLGIEDP